LIYLLFFFHRQKLIDYIVQPIVRQKIVNKPVIFVINELLQNLNVVKKLAVASFRYLDHMLRVVVVQILYHRDKSLISG